MAPKRAQTGTRARADATRRVQERLAAAADLLTDYLDAGAQVTAAETDYLTTVTAAEQARDKALAAAGATQDQALTRMADLVGVATTAALTDLKPAKVTAARRRTRKLDPPPSPDTNTTSESAPTGEPDASAVPLPPRA